MTEILVAGLSSPARPIPIPSTGASQVLYSRSAIVMGWAFIESTGAADAQVRLYSGQSAGGTLIVPISLLASQSTRDYLAPAGVLADSGVFLQVISGDVVGSLWVVDPG